MAQQQRAYPCTGIHKQRVKISTRLPHYSRRKTRNKNYGLFSEVAIRDCLAFLSNWTMGLFKGGILPQFPEQPCNSQ